MSFHFVSHLWEVQDVQNGTLVVLSQRDLDSTNINVIDDELYEIVRENGQPNLFLDFAKVHDIRGTVIAKLIALNAKLRQIGGRLILKNLGTQFHETFRAANVTDMINIYMNEYQVV